MKKKQIEGLNRKNQRKNAEKQEKKYRGQRGTNIDQNSPNQDHYKKQYRGKK